MIELLDKILDILADGKPHPINEIVSTTNGKPLHVMLCLKFLGHYNFIWIQKDTVQVWDNVKAFLSNIQKLEADTRARKWAERAENQ